MPSLGEPGTTKRNRLLSNVWVHSIAQRLHIRNVTLAKEAGMDPDKVEQYPTSIGDTIMVKNNSGWILPLAVLLSAFAAGGITKQLLMKTPDQPPIVTQPDPKPDIERKFIIRFRDPDGKIIKVPQWEKEQADESE